MVSKKPNVKALYIATRQQDQRGRNERINVGEKLEKASC